MKKTFLTVDQAKSKMGSHMGQLSMMMGKAKDRYIKDRETMHEKSADDMMEWAVAQPFNHQHKDSYLPSSAGLKR